MGIRSSIDSLKNFGNNHRATWRPFDEDSVVTRTYNWWRSETNYTPPRGRENFCHYFWVIVFFAPLLWIRQEKSRKTKAVVIAAVVGFLVVEGLIIWRGGNWWALPMVAVALWAVPCLVFGMCAYNEVADGYQSESFREFVLNMFDDDVKSSCTAIALFWVSVPVVFVVYIVCRVAGFILKSKPVGWLHDHKSQLLWAAIGTIGAAALFGFIFSGVTISWVDLFKTLGYIVAVVVGFGLVAVLLIVGLGVSELYQDHRKEKRFAAIQAGQLVKRPLAIRVLRVPWELIKLVFTFVVVVKRLAICPFIDVPESKVIAEGA